MLNRRTQNGHYLPVALTAGLIWAAGANAQSTPAESGEKFVTRTVSEAGAGTLEMRSRATVGTRDIRLRQICRWPEADAPAFAAVADLVVDRIGETGLSKDVDIETLQGTLRDAGINTSVMRFTGSTLCKVILSAAPVPSDPVPVAPKTTVATTLPSRVTTVTAAQVADAECSPFHSLRDRLMADLSQRLNVPVERLQVTFDAKDDNFLNLSEPTFRFQLDPRRVRDLGRVSWDVTVMTGDKQQKVIVAAEARAWQDQVVMRSSCGYRQVLRNEDVYDRRVLVDHVPDDTLLTRKQVVGQQAARDLKPGMLLTGRLIDPVPLVKSGQLVTITLNQGGVQVKTVAKAMETGSFGQTIRVKNEETKDTYEVTLTGPQVATMGAVPGEANLASNREDDGQ